MSNGAIIALIFAGIILIPTGIVFLILVLKRQRRQKKIKNYTGTTEGVILKVISKGMDGPDVVYVRYSVSGTDYIIHESIKYKSEPIRFGRLPIGQTLSPVMGNVEVGATVRVLYDRKNPPKAIIYGNEGSRTG